LQRPENHVQNRALRAILLRAVCPRGPCRTSPVLRATPLPLSRLDFPVNLVDQRGGNSLRRRITHAVNVCPHSKQKKPYSGTRATAGCFSAVRLAGRSVDPRKRMPLPTGAGSEPPGLQSPGRDRAEYRGIAVRDQDFDSGAGNSRRNSSGVTTRCPRQRPRGKWFLLPVTSASAPPARAASRNASSWLSGSSRE
jgi:hypothetical protein